MKENFLKLKKPWNEVRELIKEQEIDLTDADLDLKPGKEEDLLKKLSEKMHKTPEEIKKWIESLSENKAKAG